MCKESGSGGSGFGITRLYPTLEKEVFQLEAGRLSLIIKTIYGYHVVRAEEVKPPEQLSLEDVYEKVQKELTEKK